MGGKPNADHIQAQVHVESESLNIQRGQVNASNQVYEGTITTGTTTIDFYGDAGRFSVDGYIRCDGAGDLLVEVSRDGLSYDPQFTLKEEEIFDVESMKIAKIRLEHSGTDSAYRINLI